MEEHQTQQFTDIEIDLEIEDFLKPRHYLKGLWDETIDWYKKPEIEFSVSKSKIKKYNVPKEIRLGKKSLF